MNQKKFASFLSIACKFNHTCIHIFHVIYPEKAIWKTILSQTNNFIIFPSSTSLAHTRRVLESVCIRKIRKYISQSALWISKIFIELANRNDRVSLTLDCSGINEDGLGRFKTEADKPNFQTCYFSIIVWNGVLSPLFAYPPFFQNCAIPQDNDGMGWLRLSFERLKGRGGDYQNRTSENKRAGEIQI